MAPRQAVLGIEDGSFFHGSTRVFEHVSFQLDNQRTALVGENGAGKSTLLKCLAGSLELNNGKIVRSRGLRVGFVPQDNPQELSRLTARQVLSSALPQEEAEETWRVDLLVDELSIPQATANAEFGTLSGGWQRLILIAAAAKLGNPDLLILDEPTNYLDLTHINKLEDWISPHHGLGMLIVSHDREFLQRMTNRTIFLRSDGAFSFDLSFVQARTELLRLDAASAKKGQLEEREIERLEKVVARYKVWGIKNSSFHRRQKATEKRIQRIEDVKTVPYSPRKRALELSEGAINAKVVVRVIDLRITVPGGSRLLFTVPQMEINVNDRVALLGPNGTGKSVFLSLLNSAYDPLQVHYDGTATIRYNPACRVAYFDQQLDQLPLHQNLVDYLSLTEGNSVKANGLLAKAGFSHARIRGPIADLSQGERARLIFLKMKLGQPNLYLLDEPTNHLDIEGQEALESQLEEKETSCIFVSHDRYFINSVATRNFEIKGGRLIEVENADEFFDSQHIS